MKRAPPGFSASACSDAILLSIIELVVGQGSYVCGEETAMLRSIEGRRPEVMARPPYPTEHGLFGKPTLINNVETLVNVPWIVAHGGESVSRARFLRKVAARKSYRSIRSSSGPVFTKSNSA